MNAAEDVHYHEPGASGWALTWGPAFALAGWVLELLAGVPAHALLWALVGAGLLGLTALWVYARRRFLSVRVTGTELWQGGESVPVDDIAAVDDVEAPPGTRVLGGGFDVPRKYTAVPVRLTDGTVVLAWARDGAALREALRSGLVDRA
ncbi:hypothetical protein ACQPZU_01515 [Saccharomonospora azurea]|uniref:hypothetical protein n=1 Tax=Saccharomonospora azurea TaxID=40988 RepID=UPI003D901FF9